MRRIFYIVVIAAALSGCKRSELTGGGANGEPTVSFTAAFAANPADNKSTETAFENGDRVGVYLTKRDLALKGSFNAKDNKLFEYFSAGDSLAGVPNSVFYPDKTTPVAVYAYYPFAANMTNALAVPFRVSSNLKSSDLCYASLPSAAPSANTQPLAFTHSLSRLSVSVDFSANDKVESVTSITILGVVDSCYLNLANGNVTNGTHTADITGTTFILPPQVLHYGKLFRIVCKLKDGTSEEFHFEPTASPLTLLQSKKHTITLVLSASGAIALSSNQTIADWTEVTQKDGMGEGIVDNTITLHWLNPRQDYNKVAKAQVYIKDNITNELSPFDVADFILDAKSNTNLATYSFTVANNPYLQYPYIIESVALFKSDGTLFNNCEEITANVIYRPGDITISTTSSSPPTVTIAGTKWTMANLTGTAGQFGDAANIKVADNPQDYGMFFKWAATFVYGRASSSSEGAGFVSGNTTLGSSTQPTAQSKGYDYGSPLLNGPHVGDPCQKLGSSYRTPTVTQIKAMYDSGNSGWKSYQGVYGWFFGPKATSCTNTVIQDGCLFFPAAGLRQYHSGAFDYQGSGGYYWSSSVYDANRDRNLYFYSNGNISPESTSGRSFGFSVRCIQQ